MIRLAMIFAVLLVILINADSTVSQDIGAVPPPSVTTNSASSVTNSGATLNGSANPNGFLTTGWFRYSTSNPGACNDGFGVRVPASGGITLGSGNSPVPYSQPVTGLSPGTTYYFCALASNSQFATPGGAVLSFTTSSAAPASVTTNPALQITHDSVNLYSTTNPNGSATTGWFRYGTANPGTCNDTFGTRVPGFNVSLGSGTTPVDMTTFVSGLTESTTYYYCGLAQNAAGVSFGNVVAFTTPAAPAVPTAFTFQGRLTDSNASASGTFDFIFRLYPTASAGTQAGGDIVLEDVTVANGIFTVTLDFGAAPFISLTGNYLEIWVRRGNETGGFTRLLPRSPLTSSPYAIHARRATSAATADNAIAIAVRGQQLENERQQQIIEEQQKQIERQRTQLEALTKIICELRPAAAICKAPR